MYYMVNFLPPNTNYNKSRKICGAEKRISWGIDMRNSKDYENRGAKGNLWSFKRELGKCGNIGIRYEIDEWKSTHLRWFRLDLKDYFPILTLALINLNSFVQVWYESMHHFKAGHLYSSPQSPIISNKLFDFVHTASIASQSNLSKLKLNTCMLLFLWSTIPSLTPIITPATAGLARI